MLNAHPVHAHADHPLSIVVVEDNELLQEELLAFLERPGWQLRGVDSGEQLDAALNEEPADILILDLNLPEEDGLSIAQRMRAAMPHIGIVMLTARKLSQDKISGYESGADVYLTKPANINELEAVIASLARRVQRPPQIELVLDLGHQQLIRSEQQSLSLSMTEIQLLRELALAPQRRMDTDMLLQRINQQSNSHLNRENLAVLISRLRSKMTQMLNLSHSIKAIRGFGYQLNSRIVVRAP